MSSSGPWWLAHRADNTQRTRCPRRDLGGWPTEPTLSVDLDAPWRPLQMESPVNEVGYLIVILVLIAKILDE
jgi:hypothetical protein